MITEDGIEELRRKYSYDQATPVMQQYLNLKFAHIDCLVLFRLGDFYELFFEDAVQASRVLNIALTARGKNAEEEVPMCGIPYHALENYLPKLLQEGYKVAICEQLETPEEAKKRGGYKAVVAREVVRIITPGTLTEESLITAVTPNYLVSIVQDKDKVGICYADISTTEIGVMEVAAQDALNHLARLAPKELLISDKLRLEELGGKISQLGLRATYQVDSFFAESKCRNIILRFYNIADLAAIGTLTEVQVRSLGSILEYIALTQKHNMPRLELPRIINQTNIMSIDASARKNLEITANLSGHRGGSLLDMVDYTVTKAGSRRLHQLLSAPLTCVNAINTRLSITEFFFGNLQLSEVVRKLLHKTGDLDRCLSRLSMHRSSPRDLLSIKYTLEAALDIKALFVQCRIDSLSFIETLVEPLAGDEQLIQLIEDAVRDDAPVGIVDGGIIKHEYHPKIAELYGLIENGKEYIDKLKEQYRQETGVDNVKITHNNLLGLFVEVTLKNAPKFSDAKFIHRQTTANSARYTTPELQKLESDMLGAKTLVVSLEQEIYGQICSQVMQRYEILKKLAGTLAELDVYTNFAYAAYENNYTKPEITSGIDFVVQDGWHPVVQQACQKENRSFVKNNCHLEQSSRIWLLTGPNMSGKSTFLRQNALIAILAQVGSFVPASYARIGVIDKIFSRIGAGDDLMKNQSTFMVEMLETSAILAQATEKSLIILDEIGRGTSTYDGVAIAWSVLEYVHDKLRSRCLFATHYHELTAMDNFLPALKNYTIAIEEVVGTILFLHKIIEGAADRSYGIHVAALAGLPKSVINRANDIMMKLEKESAKRNKEILKAESHNLSLFDL